MPITTISMHKDVQQDVQGGGHKQASCNRNVVLARKAKRKKAQHDHEPSRPEYLWLPGQNCVNPRALENCTKGTKTQSAYAASWPL